ncbi:MAG: hypothetical protein CMO55_10260 [Verrucomicrobiales bacterium]|nr:hypothetical protein [Verrucomicrobiales bacterium]
MSGERKISSTTAKKRITETIQSRFPDVALAPKGKTALYYPNLKTALLPGIDSELVKADLKQGAGGELRGDLPPFHAPYSSAALCVNVFGPARTDPTVLEIYGLSGFSDFAFEKKMPTGISHPHLDFAATTGSTLLGVESKYLEPLDLKKPSFEVAYEEAFANCECPVLNEAYLSVKAGKQSFERLDVAQLLKHALGLNQKRNEFESLILGSVYWTPTNASEFSVYTTMREETERFANLLEGSRVQFVSTTYPQLWDEWEEKKVMPEHLARVRERYEMEL